MATSRTSTSGAQHERRRIGYSRLVGDLRRGRYCYLHGCSTSPDVRFCRTDGASAMTERQLADAMSMAVAFSVLVWVGMAVFWGAALHRRDP